eukprot:5490263-Ditylum_brightwellii.AAC.1
MVMNIMYYDFKTYHVKAATCTCFDGGMNNLDKPTPTVSQLRKALGKDMDSDEKELTSPNELN